MTNKTFKILALLLMYPKAELVSELPHFLDVLADEALLTPEDLQAVTVLITKLQQTDLLELQENYVALFDRSRLLSLHLFEHVHGESRDRGQAMVDLAASYQKANLALKDGELPDYLPVFLEFASSLPLKEAAVLLAEPINILATLEARLKERQSAYQSVFSAILSLADGEADPKIIEQTLDNDKTQESELEDLEELDKQWEERPVTFGGEGMGSDCGSCSYSEKQ